MTAATDRETKLKALELGTHDFLEKPVDPSELAPRVRNALVIKQYQNELANHACELEAKVKARTKELEQSREEVIHCLARAAEFRDHDTGNHIIRVGKYAAAIAEELGFDKQQCDLLEKAAQLHDVGKIGVPDKVLLKPGKLTPEEYSLMQQHVEFGEHILTQMPETEWRQLQGHSQMGAKILHIKDSPILELASRIALTHHEKFDGTGYPLGLSGQDIPIEGRITAIADVFDALSMRRPYKLLIRSKGALKCWKRGEEHTSTPNCWMPSSPAGTTWSRFSCSLQTLKLQPESATIPRIAAPLGLGQPVLERCLPGSSAESEHSRPTGIRVLAVSTAATPAVDCRRLPANPVTCREPFAPVAGRVHHGSRAVVRQLIEQVVLPRQGQERAIKMEIHWCSATTQFSGRAS